jgi:UDP:flavonoid glycosyltransferase YjiC (YdhE family)
MAKVLLTAWPLAGHLSPCVAIARELRRRGHDVAFYSGERARPALERDGFPLFPFRCVSEAQFERTMLAPGRATSWTRPLAFLALLQRWFGDTLAPQARDLEGILSAWAPDAIVSEEGMWAPPLVLKERCGVPVIVCSVIAGSLLPGRDMPLPGIGLAPPRSAPARACHRAMKALADRLAGGLRTHVNGVRRGYGLPPLRASIREAVGDVPLYLVRGCPEFDHHRRDLPACVQYAGPLDAVEPSPGGPPAWIEALPRDRAIVYVSEGSMPSGPPALLQAAVRGLAPLGVHVVIATGGRDPAALGFDASAPNFTIKEWVPQRDLFLRTDAVVTVGGCGTVLGALAAAVPVLAAPAEMDQPDNARRVVEAGVGLSIPRHRCTPRRLARAVGRLLAEPAFRRGAARLAERFARYRGAGHAADLIELQLPNRSGGVDDEAATRVGAEEVRC